MSHILHFYHLVALDYVIPTVDLNAGTPPPNYTALNRPFVCPRYDNNYYITTARVNAMAGVMSLPVFGGAYALALGAITGLPGFGANPGGAVNAYLTGQYLAALNIRRICHQMQAIFSGRAPQCSGFTPGGATATVDQASINKYQSLLNQVATFIGDPLDFLNGTAGTMMFDVVAAAHLFPEYFWIGNSWNNYMCNGWGEEAGTIPLSGALAVLFGATYSNPDNRAIKRGYLVNPAGGGPAAASTLDIRRIGESIANSKYNAYTGTGAPGNANFRHPWLGQTSPDPSGSYSWLKSPRYNDVDPVGAMTDPGYKVFEVGPLARMWVNGTYWAGMLNGQGTVLGAGGLYPLAPTAGALGPSFDPAAPSGHPLEVPLIPIYAAIPPGLPGGPNLAGVAYNGDSVLDRIAARALEARLMVDDAQHFLTQLQSTIGGSGYGASGCTDRFGEEVPSSPQTYRGYGMTEASRGALSHWIAVNNGRTTLYQAVVPTTWNASPRDANGNEGPAERSLQGPAGLGIFVTNPAEPIEVIRVTHSYDFCIACAVHLISPEGEVKEVEVPALPG
jgi:Ni,Fe-hydrogenase I large subunit